MVHGGVERGGGGDGNARVALGSGKRYDMRLDSRAADSRVGGRNGAVEDEDGGLEEGVDGVVKGKLLQRQAREGTGCGSHDGGGMSGCCAVLGTSR